MKENPTLLSTNAHSLFFQFSKFLQTLTFLQIIEIRTNENVMLESHILNLL